ncbi:MAG: hypothetical protein K6T92_06680 [Candidatus Rokubacteria bacterium]|nr:hypothetical protein [Candidatus Rokubacteria bacterium]
MGHTADCPEPPPDVAGPEATAPVRRVGDVLREEERRALAGLTPTERVRLALALGERDLETFRRAHGLDRTEAVRRLDRQRQRGRRFSACARAGAG